MEDFKNKCIWKVHKLSEVFLQLAHRVCIDALFNLSNSEELKLLFNELKQIIFANST